MSVGADVLKQIICYIQIRRAPAARHDNIDFKPIITRTSEIKPLSVVVADKGYDSEENHVFVREYLKAYASFLLETCMFQYGRRMVDIENK